MILLPILLETRHPADKVRGTRRGLQLVWAAYRRVGAAFASVCPRPTTLPFSPIPPNGGGESRGARARYQAEVS